MRQRPSSIHFWRPPSSRLEGVLGDQVPLDRILQVLAPVQLDRARNVPLLVDVGILVHLGDDDTRVVQVLSQPPS